VIATRRPTGSAVIAPGRVDLWLFSTVEQAVIIPGLDVVYRRRRLPEGTTCQPDCNVSCRASDTQSASHPASHPITNSDRRTPPMHPQTSHAGRSFRLLALTLTLPSVLATACLEDTTET
jgi:hypothetical protein